MLSAQVAQDMRYLQLMYTYAPAWGFGGPSRMMYDYARWLARHGAGADVIAGDIHHDYTANPKRVETIDGIRIRRVRVFLRQLVKRALNCVSPAMFLLGLSFIRRAPSVTVVHIAEFRSPVFLYAAWLRRLLPRRVVLVHSAFGMLHDKPSRLRSLYDPVFMRFMLRSVDIALAQNEHEAASYRTYCLQYGARAVRVELLPLHTAGPNIEATGITNSNARAALRAQYGVSADAFVCIFLGRLHAEKGVLRAIDAFLGFMAVYKRPAVFLVVGRDDGFQATIAAHIAARSAENFVRVVNDVYQERFDYYALSDLFLGFPTIYEETMLASVEALSCGTPVLVSREADLPYVEGAGAGYVIDFSIEAAIERMVRVAADPDGHRARARAVSSEHFKEGSACAAFQNIIENAAQERAAKVNPDG